MPHSNSANGTPTATNILGTPLEPCSLDPLTGFFRDGSCRTCSEDTGQHTVCAVLTREFLDFTRSKGNDLSTPRPEWGFPGLNHGDRWCLCAARWLEAQHAGVAPPIIPASTDASAAQVVPIDTLLAHARPQED